MKRTLLVTAVAATLASVASADSYTDASNDLFDNGFDNLDITGVSMSDDGVNMTISITTRGYQNWTKYMMYFNTSAGGTTSNAWSRPVNLSGTEIDYYIGSWVDAATNTRSSSPGRAARGTGAASSTSPTR